MSGTQPQITRQNLVDAINDQLDVPFITEEVEAQLIDRALGQIIDYIPVAFWPILADAAKGIDIEVIRKFADALTRVIVDNIDDRYSAMPRHMRNLGTSARSALPRWLRAFFSSLESSALVRLSGKTSSGSYPNPFAPRGAGPITPSKVPRDSARIVPSGRAMQRTHTKRAVRCASGTPSSALRSFALFAGSRSTRVANFPA
jgi:hypothetical protein